jgi:hypothetical protein
MTAAGIITRIYCGQKNTDGLIPKSADLILKDVPEFDNQSLSVNYYYWFHGAKALILSKSAKKGDWIKALKYILVSNQSKKGCKAGSWDSVCEWSIVGGRIYGTAMNALTLEMILEDARNRK